MTEGNQFLHIPLLDRMRAELSTRRYWREKLSAEDLKSLLDQGLEVGLKTKPEVSVAKNLEVQLEGNKAYIEGDAEIRFKGAIIYVNIDELTLGQEAPGRLGVDNLRYGLRLDKQNADIFVSLFGNVDAIKSDLETRLRDPNRLIWTGISGQLSEPQNVTKFALNLVDGELVVLIESKQP